MRSVTVLSTMLLVLVARAARADACQDAIVAMEDRAREVFIARCTTDLTLEVADARMHEALQGMLTGCARTFSKNPAWRTLEERSDVRALMCAAVAAEGQPLDAAAVAQLDGLLASAQPALAGQLAGIVLERYVGETKRQGLVIAHYGSLAAARVADVDYALACPTCPDAELRRRAGRLVALARSEPLARAQGMSLLAAEAMLAVPTTRLLARLRAAEDEPEVARALLPEAEESLAELARLDPRFAPLVAYHRATLDAVRWRLDVDAARIEGINAALTALWASLAPGRDRKALGAELHAALAPLGDQPVRGLLERIISQRFGVTLALAAERPLEALAAELAATTVARGGEDGALRAKPDHCYLLVTDDPSSVIPLDFTILKGWQALGLQAFQVYVGPRMAPGFCAVRATEVPRASIPGARWALIGWPRAKVPEVIGYSVMLEVDTCDARAWEEAWTHPVPGSIAVSDGQPVLRDDYYFGELLDGAHAKLGTFQHGAPLLGDEVQRERGDCESFDATAMAAARVRVLAGARQALARDRYRYDLWQLPFNVIQAHQPDSLAPPPH